MQNSAGFMALHFRIRLWIAEMNADITILRIFEDYVTEIAGRKNEPAAKDSVRIFQEHFVQLRKEIDELRHEMHLSKMTLAAYDREMKSGKTKPTMDSAGHAGLRKRYTAYRKMFNRIKKEFGLFEAHWLS